jgi:anti-anti-sigma factor
MKVTRLAQDIWGFLGRTNSSFGYESENRFTPQPTSSVEIVRLDGDVDVDGVDALRLSLLECIRDGKVNIILNLGNCGYVSIMGIGVLVERLRQIRSCGGDLVLVGVNVYLERLLKMTGVKGVFSIYENEEQALQHFDMRTDKAVG